MDPMGIEKPTKDWELVVQEANKTFAGRFGKSPETGHTKKPCSNGYYQDLVTLYCSSPRCSAKVKASPARAREDADHGLSSVYECRPLPVRVGYTTRTGAFPVFVLTRSGSPICGIS